MPEHDPEESLYQHIWRHPSSFIATEIFPRPGVWSVTPTHVDLFIPSCIESYASLPTGEEFVHTFFRGFLRSLLCQERVLTWAGQRQIPTDLLYQDGNSRRSILMPPYQSLTLEYIFPPHFSIPPHSRFERGAFKRYDSRCNYTDIRSDTASKFEIG